MTAQDLELNVNRLNTARSLLWKTKSSPEVMAEHISDTQYKVKSVEGSISMESVRAILRDVETFLVGQKPN